MALQLKRDYLDQKVLERLSTLQLHARLPMIGNVSGKHRSPIRGSSLEFAEYRKYVPGDDTRRLDWRAYARNDRYYIKEFEADTNLRMCLIVDTSGSMGFAYNGISKLDYARRIGGTLAYIAALQGDAVGLYCAGETFHREIPPKRSATHLSTVLDELGAIEPTGETGLADTLHEAAENAFRNAHSLSSFQISSLNRKWRVTVLSTSDSENMMSRCFISSNRMNSILNSTDRCGLSTWKAANLCWQTQSSLGTQYRRALEVYLESMDEVSRDTRNRLPTVSCIK